MILDDPLPSTLRTLQQRRRCDIGIFLSSSLTLFPSFSSVSLSFSLAPVLAFPPPPSPRFTPLLSLFLSSSLSLSLSFSNIRETAPRKCTDDPFEQLSITYGNKSEKGRRFPLDEKRSLVPRSYRRQDVRRAKHFCSRLLVVLGCAKSLARSRLCTRRGMRMWLIVRATYVMRLTGLFWYRFGATLSIVAVYVIYRDVQQAAERWGRG